jgi:nucleotide-binding universal stress UspA family protein
MAAEDPTHEPPIAPTRFSRLAAAIDLSPASVDAAVLAAAIGGADADVLLIAIEPDLAFLILPDDEPSVRHETERLLGNVRSAYVPDALITVGKDLSIAHGLRRIADERDRQLLILGSSRRARTGAVAIGQKTRQLLDHLPCSLAIAARGLAEQPTFKLSRVGIGFDGGSESEAALAAAAGIAATSGAELVIRGVVDDRIPALAWPDLWLAEVKEIWGEVIDHEVRALQTLIDEHAAHLNVTVTTEVTRGRPATSLSELADDVQLLVIGSRRWGPMARLLLGGTGEALVNGAGCSLLLVPRPAAES